MLWGLSLILRGGPGLVDFRAPNLSISLGGHLGLYAAASVAALRERPWNAPEACRTIGSVAVGIWAAKTGA